MYWDNFSNWVEWRAGWPSMDDLGSGHVFTPSDGINRVNEVLSHSDSCVLSAGEGRGKSTLGACVGYRAIRDEKPVWVADFSGHRDSVSELKPAIRSRDKADTLWILDNCRKATSEEIAAVSEGIRSSEHSSFLLCLRKATERQAKEWSSSIRLGEDKRIPVFFFSPDVAVVGGVLRTHVQRKNLRNGTTVRVTDQDAEKMLEQTGGNLRVLAILIDCLDPARKELGAVTDTDIFKSIIKEKLQPLVQSEGALDTYIDICAVFQFDVPVWVGACDLSAVLHLEERGLVARTNHGGIRLPHSTDAALSVSAFAVMRSERRQSVIESRLETYFARDLRLWYATHFLDGLQYGIQDGLILKTEELENQLCREVLAHKKHPTIVKSLIEALEPSPQDLRQRISENPETTGEILRSSGMNHVRSLVSSVKKIDEDLGESLWEFLDRDDKIVLNAQDSLSSLGKTLRYYENSARAHGFAKGILQKVLDSKEVDLESKVERGAIRSAGRLLDIAYDIDSRMADRLAESIAGNANLTQPVNSEELSLLLTHSESNSDAYEFLLQRVLRECDPSTLFAAEPQHKYHHMLRHIAVHYADLPERVKEETREFFRVFSREVNCQILDKISDGGLTYLIFNFAQVGIDPMPWLSNLWRKVESRVVSMSSEHAFYAVWNIVGVDKDAGKDLSAALVPTLEDRVGAKKGRCFAVPLVGLIEHLEVDYALDSEPDSVDEIVDEWSKREDGTRLIYGMLGLKALNRKQYGEAQRELAERFGNVKNYLRKLIESHPLAEPRQNLKNALDSLEENG